MKYRLQLKQPASKITFFLKLCILMLIGACSSSSNKWENINEEGAFLVYRRQSLIGEESYSIISNKDSIIIKSLQGENERGRITGVEAELHLKMDLTPTYYQNRRLTNRDTIVNLKVQTDLDSISVWERNQEFAIVETLDARNTTFQRVALALGYRTWDVGTKNEERDLVKIEAKEAKEKARKQKVIDDRAERKRLKEVEKYKGKTEDEIKQMKRRDSIVDTNKSAQMKSLINLGLTKKQIKELKYEDDRVNKIIELTNK